MEIRVTVIKAPKWHKAEHPETGKKGYILDEDYTYYSKRYNKYKTIYKRMWSDGATGFIDIGANNWCAKICAWVRNRIRHMVGNEKSVWFFVHDGICNDGLWDDGSRISNWEASTVAGDILWDSGYRFLSVPVWHATFLFGGGAAKQNGWFTVKNDEG